MSRSPGCNVLDHTLGRRAFLGSAAGFAVGGSAGLNVLGNPTLGTELKRRGKRAILLFLSGGASQFETWDPKPGQATGGPFQTIETSVPGVHICELLPLMAQRLHKHTAIIRSISTANTNHEGRDVQRLLSGERKDTGNLETPSLGCLLAKELSRPDDRLPANLAFYSAYVGLTLNNQSDFAGFLGARYQPINILSRLSPDSCSVSSFFQAATSGRPATSRLVKSCTVPSGSRMRSTLIVPSTIASARAAGCFFKSQRERTFCTRWLRIFSGACLNKKSSAR